MISKEVIDFISFWGGIASIIALFIVFINYLKSQIIKAKEIKLAQEEKYNKIKNNVQELTDKANSFKSLQSIYLFMDILLSQERHKELRIRINLISTTIIIFLMIIFVVLILKFIDDNNLLMIALKSILLFNVCLLIYFNYKIYKILLHISNKNDTFSNEFLKGISTKIEI